MSQAADDFTIAAAAHCFGGHISRGLLRRARAANNRRIERVTKTGRAELFARIKALPPLWRPVAETWNEVREILAKCVIYADLGDPFSYHAASRAQYCHEFVEGLRAFVIRYGGKRRAAKLLPNLFLLSPVERGV